MDWRIMLIIMMLLSSPVFLTIPEGSWLSPEYSLVEDWTLDPFEFVSTERTFIGCITESEENSGYDWDITLLDANRVIRFEDGQQVDRINIGLSLFQQPRISFSPGGNYLLLFDSQDADCMRIDLEEMQVERTHLVDNHVQGSTYPRITDSGSIVVNHAASQGGSRLRRIFDGNLVLVFEDFGYGQISEYLTYDREGNRFFFTKGKRLIAVNGSGQEIWRTEISMYEDGSDVVRGFVTDSFGNALAVQKTSLLQLFSGDTGTACYSEAFDFIVVNPLFSSSGNFLALETMIYDEMFNFSNGILLYSIDLQASEVVEIFHSIYSNRESPRFCPVSVSDNGMVLAKLSNLPTGLHRLILLDSSGNAVWISEPVSARSSAFISWTAGMTHDGSVIWYFDDNLVHSYQIEKI